MSIWIARRPAVACGVAATVLGSSLLAQDRRPADQGFSFRSSVELVSVNATVTDANGHFVPGLRAEDFTITEDGERQTITQFESERVPVSLGIVLDTSGSMAGEKMDAAREALRRFVYDLLGPTDEMFLYRFDSQPVLVQGWTEDRARLMRGLGSVRPSGGTALYDAVADAVPLAGEGSRRKKALVVISDGNDTNSELEVDELQQLIRESEVMVYAIGIDASASPVVTRRPQRLPLPGGIVLPWPPGPEPAATAAAAAVASRRRCECERARAAHDHRRHRRAHGDRRRRPQSRSGDGRDRQRAQPAVFSRLRLDPAQGRPLAHDQGAAQEPQLPGPGAPGVCRRIENDARGPTSQKHDGAAEIETAR